MSDRWAIRLSLKHLHRVGELRGWPGLDAAVNIGNNGDMLWLRGDGLDPAMQRILATIADDHVFQLADDGRLTAYGHAVLTACLPNLDWRKLTEFLQPVLPAARMTSVRFPRVALSLQSSSNVPQEALLVTEWDSFFPWAVAAPEIRLLACRVAVSWQEDTARVSKSIRSARVVVQGNPLPSIDGERFWLAGCVAVPLGYHWTPLVDVATLEASIRKLIGTDAGPNPLFLWNRNDRSIEVVEGTNFIPVTRGNVRFLDQTPLSRSNK